MSTQSSTLTIHSLPSVDPAVDPHDLASYFSPETISTVFEDLGWNAASELAILIDIAQNGEPSEQLNAIRQIRSIAQTALSLTGRITKTVLHARPGPASDPTPKLTGGTSISNRLATRVAPAPLAYDPTVRPIDIAANPLTHDNFSTTPALPTQSHSPTPDPT